MSGSRNTAVQELNMRMETRFRVEIHHRRYCERRHYRRHLRTSEQLQAALTGKPQPGTVRTAMPLPDKHPERRHFEQSYKCHLGH